MRVSGKHGQGKTDNVRKCCAGSLGEIVHAIVELSGMCAESARAGGDAWYEVSVYVHKGGLTYQVQRHGSVVGGETRLLPCGCGLANKASLLADFISKASLTPMFI